MTKYMDLVAVQAELRKLAGLPVARRAEELYKLWWHTRVGSAARAAVEAAYVAARAAAEA